MSSRVLHSNNQGGSASSVTKRLQTELMTLMGGKHVGISAFPAGDNFLVWVGTVTGPKDSVYEGLTYKLSLKFPVDYPFSAPTVTFDTPCFHPNVDDKGAICLDILKENWSAVYNVSTILLSIQSLLADPNPNSPLNGYAASLWRDVQEYKSVLLSKYENQTV